MRNKNSSTINFLKKNEEFADIVNLVLFQGKSVIKAEHLSELNPSESIYITKSNSNNKKSENVQRYRDVLKSVKLNEKESCNIQLMVGTEAQSEVHYAMPVRNMVYDALNYAMQIKEQTIRNRENRNYSNSKEFLSGLTKTDRLIPVITIVVFFGNGKWDGPVSLHQMLDFDGFPESLTDKMPDYKMMILSPNFIEDRDLENMTSSAGYVLGAIKHSKNKKELENYIEKNKDVFVHFPGYAAAVLNEFCNLEMKDEDIQKGEVDMCQAVVEIREEGFKEGEKQGIRLIICNALRNGHTPEQVSSFNGISLEEVLEVKTSMDENE